MKKFFALLFVCFAAAGLVFAEGFAFKTVNAAPLYREPVADPYNYSTHFYLTAVLPEDDCDLPMRVLLRDENDNYFYRNVSYRDNLGNLNMNFKVATEADVLYFNFNDKVELTGVLAGSLNALFSLTGSTPCLGVDGSYFYGGAMRFMKTFSVRFGVHHFSSHYGNEIYEQFFQNNEFTASGAGNGHYGVNIVLDGTNYELRGFTEYVRDNSYLLALSADLPKGFRIYSEYEIPQNPAWIRPWFHNPKGHLNPSASNPSVHKVAGGEGVGDPELINEEDAAKDSLYLAMRIHAGLEWRVPVGMGDFVLGCDVQAHQDGQTKHQIGEYDPSNPWEFEYTATASMELAKALLGEKAISIDVIYHYGRTPSLNYFYKTGSFVMVGVGVH